MDSTSVETQTFYFMSSSGQLGCAQVIYSNVVYGTLLNTEPELFFLSYL